MDSTNIPAKFPIPFGADAGASYIRAIPETSTDPNAASLSLGFPPNTGTPVGAGGSPPDIRDENGILNQLSAWAQWQSLRGPIYWDSDQSTAVGGYPKGALLDAAGTVGSYWISTVDNNVTNPDAAGAGWTRIQLAGLGTAAYKNTTSLTYSMVAAVKPSVVVGHIAVFADTNGTIEDGGPVFTGGTAAEKDASDNSQPLLASVNGGTTSGNFASFADGRGTVKDSGASPFSFDLAGAAAAAQAAAQTFATNAANTAQSNAQTFATNADATVLSSAKTYAAAQATAAQENSEAYTDAQVTIERNRAEGVENIKANINSPSFTGVPSAPTPPTNSADGTVPNTAWVKSLIGSADLATPGFFTVGGVIVQWAIGPTDPADNSEPSHFVGWATGFPSQCAIAIASCDLAATTGSMDSWYQTVGWNQSGVTVQRQRPANGSWSVQTRSVVIGIGW